MPSPLTLYYHATESWPAAILLHEIVYWMPKAKARWDGVRWIAKSAAEWCEDTALTHEQYKAAIARLRQLGLIKTEQHLFNGRNITHLRLTEKATTWVGPVATSRKGPETPPEQGLKTPLITGLTTETYKQDKDCVLTHATSAATLEEDPGEKTMKAKDLFSKKMHKPQEYLSLESLWKTTVIDVYGGYVSTFNVKQRTQLKQFAGKCPEGKAAEVLEFTLRHWSGFAKAAEHDAGAFKTPARPELGFLLRFADVAINYWNTSVQLTATKPAAQAGKPTAVLVKPGWHG